MRSPPDATSASPASSDDAIAFKQPDGRVAVIDIGLAWEDTSRQMKLQWLEVGGQPGYTLER